MEKTGYVYFAMGFFEQRISRKYVLSNAKSPEIAPRALLFYQANAYLFKTTLRICCPSWLVSLTR